MATQVQIRGASQATQEARTLVSRELDINTTDNRLCVHNGSTAGGIRHVNMYDQQNNEFNYAQASGTNALTASMRFAPSSYVAGQVFWIKIANTNTGSVSLNIDSLGAKTVKKVFNNALTNLQANDLISGQMIGVLYDGTDFQIVSGSGSEAGAQLWIPSGDISSYEAANCLYVDYGDSVTVSFDVTVTGDDVTNFPFNPLFEIDYTLLPYNVSGGNSETRSTLRMNGRLELLQQPATGQQISGMITYIKG